MATDQRARDLGFVTPASTDLIRDGDDAISQNARAAVDLHDRSVVIANAARAMAAASITSGITRDGATGRLYYAPPPIIADTFDRPDESPVGPSPLGYAPLVVAAALPATLAVSSRQLAFINTVGTSSFATWDTQRTDGTFAMTIPEHGLATDGLPGSGIVVRATADVADALVLDALGPDAPQYRLRSRTSGTWEVEQYLLGVQAAAGDRVEVTLDGPQVTVTINGDPRLTADFPNHTTGTRVGVACYGRRYGVRYDDMAFSPIGV